MTSTPDTPNMTDAPRITEKHIDYLRGSMMQLNPSLPKHKHYEEVVTLLRSIHEGNVVVVRREELEALSRGLAGWVATHPAFPTSYNVKIMKWLGEIPAHTDTTDATTQEANNAETGMIDETAADDPREIEHEWPCEHATGGAGACEDSNCPASRDPEIRRLRASLEEAEREIARLRKDADDMYWLMEDAVCRADDLEVEMCQGQYESLFDALAAIRRKADKQKEQRA